MSGQKPFAVIGERVVQAAAEMRRASVLERGRGAPHGAAHHQAERVGERRHARQLERRDLVRRQGVRAQLLETVTRRVDQREIVPRSAERRA